jgi:hypothetical protein
MIVMYVLVAIANKSRELRRRRLMRFDILRLPTTDDSQERLEQFETLRQEAEQQAQHWQEMSTIEQHVYQILGGQSDRR